MPMICNILEKMFPNSNVVSLKDSEKLISNGAALYGCMLKGIPHKPPSFY